MMIVMTNNFITIMIIVMEMYYMMIIIMLIMCTIIIMSSFSLDCSSILDKNYYCDLELSNDINIEKTMMLIVMMVSIKPSLLLIYDHYSYIN